MNSDNQSNECMPSMPETAICQMEMPTNPQCCQQEPQQPICPREKLEPANLTQYICGPKMCSIFGGHDTNYYPENNETCLTSNSKQKRLNYNTLGSPVGLVSSSFVLKSNEVKSSELHGQRYATCLKAFAKIYLTPESEWDSAGVDMLLREGQYLYADSMKIPESQREESAAHIYSDLEAKIKRSFELGGCQFQLELAEKFQITPFEKNGDEPAPELTVDYMKATLKGFFRGMKYCLVKLNNWYLLVWKSRGVYFVFDFYGRRLNDFLTDREGGVAMLICLKGIENVCHLILSLSGLQRKDTFSLRELKVVKLTGPDGKTMTREFGKRLNQFEVISPDYAYLTATLHLTLNIADPLRSRSALPVGVATILAAKIDHPATWNKKVLDKLICYGVNICRCCWEQCLNSKEPMDLDRFPTQLKLGQFLTSYSFIPRIHEGTWKCVPNYKKSELNIAIEKSFEANENNLLVQVGHQIYAVFRKNNFIYFFDPYRHRIVGNLTTETVNDKSATLRMFRNYETFISVFHQTILESNRTSPFYIHKMKIKRIILAEKAEGVPKEEDIPEDADVKSLNEQICFEEDETKCKDELGEISDYEDEDITAGFQKIELKLESESEESEGVEEEEGGMEDLGEYESSSSGDGDGHSRRKQTGAAGKGSGKGKGGDGKQGKGKGKGGKGKTGKTKDKMSDKDGKDKKKKDDKGKKRKNKPGKTDDESDDESKKNKGKKRKTKPGKSDDESDDESKKKKKKKPSGDSSKDESQGKSKGNKEDDDGKKTAVEDKNKDKEGKDKNKGDRDGKSISSRGLDSRDGDARGDNRDGRDSNRDGKDDNKDGRYSSSDPKSQQRHRESDDDDAFGTGTGGMSDTQGAGCKPNNYPGYSSVAHDMAVVGSESGTYESICKLLRAGFKCADRILTMTPWGNYVVFRGFNMYKKIYFLFDGCTCNVDRFRHLDLNCGTAGLLCFPCLHDVICYIIDTEKIYENLKKSRKNIIDDICRQYC